MEAEPGSLAWPQKTRAMPVDKKGDPLGSPWEIFNPLGLGIRGELEADLAFDDFTQSDILRAELFK